MSHDLRPGKTRRPLRSHSALKAHTSTARRPTPSASSASLDSQQLLLPLHTPAIASQRPVTPDNPVAGNNNSDRVGTASPGHRPNSSRLTDGLCQLRIAARLPPRNLPQSLPYPCLEW